MTTTPNKWLRSRGVMNRLSIGATSLYRLIGEEGFPAPVKLGRCSVWSEAEIEAFMAARAASPREMTPAGPGRKKASATNTGDAGSEQAA
jgi:predicted DNA-binding transcriptional regulator AlpA